MIWSQSCQPSHARDHVPRLPRDGEASSSGEAPGIPSIVGNSSGSKRWYLQKLNDSIDILKMYKMGLPSGND